MRIVFIRWTCRANRIYDEEICIPTSKDLPKKIIPVVQFIPVHFIWLNLYACGNVSIFPPLKENEIFQQTLKTTQRKLLRASRDKTALLDRLVQYERIELSSSDDELTESSDDGESVKPEPKRY